MRTPPDERETIIAFMFQGDTATIYTSDYQIMRKFDKLVDESDDWKQARKEQTHEGDVVGKFYECPKKFITFRSKKKKVVKRDYSEEERKSFAERMKLVRRQKV